MAQKYFITASPQHIVAEAIKILYGHLKEQPALNQPQTIADYLRLKYANLEYEQFGVLGLDNGNHLIEDLQLFRGTVNATAVYPREVFRQLLLLNAVSFVAYHNHPSGNTIPSQADIDITQKLKKAGELLNIKLLDHIVVSPKGHYSFYENGLI